MVSKQNELTAPLEGKTIVVLDTETTGLNAVECEIIEFAAKRYYVKDGKLEETGSLSFLVRTYSDKGVPSVITTLTGITQQMADNGFPPAVGGQLVRDFIGGSILVAHHAPFDMEFIERQFHTDPRDFVCTRAFAKLFHPEDSASLKDVAVRFGIEQSNAHRAMADVDTTAAVLEKLIEHSSDRVPLNVLVASPDRALKFIPKRTQAILDPWGAQLVRYY